MEIAGAGVLALTAPAGLWTGLGRPDVAGWLLWGVIWAQMAASIVHVYARLEQRKLADPPSRGRLLEIARPALATASVNLIVLGLLGAAGTSGRWLFLAYVPQWLETIRGAVRPASGLKPAQIGIRQLAVSALYTLVFMVTWR